MNSLHLRSRRSLPLGAQLMALLVCALIAAQMVTLGLTVLFPPEAPTRWNMDDVARGLSGATLPATLERQRMAGPPDISGPGWLVSQSSHAALATRLHRAPQDVVLAFYTQLPVGGVAAPVRNPLAMNDPVPWQERFALIGKAHAGTGPGGPGGDGAMPGVGFPGGRFPGGGFPGGGMPGGGLPGGHFPGGMPGGRPQGAPPGAPGGGMPGGSAPTHPAPAPATGGFQHSSAMASMPTMAPATLPLPPQALAPQPLPMPSPAPLVMMPIAQPAPIATLPPRAPHTEPALPPAPQIKPAQSLDTLPAWANPLPHGTTHAAPARPQPKPQPIPFRRANPALFGLSPPPFIEGDFIAALRQSDGTWIAVAPRAEPFPNRWQMQVIAWFLLSLAIVSPLAWAFARRIVRPLQGFAEAAEMLGRDPSATILPLSGPAEIGRAAYAFNQMRHRLRAFVDDRTAMVGAISHDLRTPLTRLRFRVEDVPDEQRDGILKEVTEMEAMIAHVLAFIRDASTPGKREMVDLGDLVAGSVQDAQMVGARIELEGNTRLPVEVDPMGMRRLLGNLLENAVKYGDHARVRLSIRDGEAVADIIDDGPGIPEAEWARVFEPFYRTETARKSGKPGSGLGLAVCRSIARAHGGDVVLSRGAEGFVASVSVPLVGRAA